MGGGTGSTIFYPAKPVGEDIIVVAADDISVKTACGGDSSVKACGSNML